MNTILSRKVFYIALTLSCVAGARAQIVVEASSFEFELESTLRREGYTDTDAETHSLELSGFRQVAFDAAQYGGLHHRAEAFAGLDTFKSAETILVRAGVSTDLSAEFRQWYPIRTKSKANLSIQLRVLETGYYKYFAGINTDGIGEGKLDIFRNGILENSLLWNGWINHLEDPIIFAQGDSYRFDFSLISEIDSSTLERGSGWATGELTVQLSAPPVVPEPGTMIALSLGVVALLRKRRTK
jgi:hypothetical protein